MANANSKLTWSPVGLDVNGNPKVVVNYDVAASASGTDLNVSGSATYTAVVPHSASPERALAGFILQDGNYSLQVRARDTAGNVSAWSAKLEVGVELVPPAAPVNLAIV